MSIKKKTFLFSLPIALGIFIKVAFSSGFPLLATFLFFAVLLFPQTIVKHIKSDSNNKEKRNEMSLPLMMEPSEKNNCKITLISVPANAKIMTIKTIRNIYGFDLATAKNIAETPNFCIERWIPLEVAKENMYELTNFGVRMKIDIWEEFAKKSEETAKHKKCKYCQQQINSTTGICEHCGAPQ